MVAMWSTGVAGSVAMTWSTGAAGSTVAMTWSTGAAGSGRDDLVHRRGRLTVAMT